MTLRDRSAASGLDRGTTTLLCLAFVLALFHHADHALRVDHSGWPFRADVTPFTFSLLAYPVMLFALFGPRRLYWLRWALLLVATVFTVLAHVAVESPQMQYAMWARDRSIDPHGAGLHNIPDVRSTTLGMVSVVIGMALNVTAVAATIAMFVQGRRLGRRA